MKNRLSLLKVLTNSSLLHPTRLSMICANLPQHRNIREARRPRNLTTATSRTTSSDGFEPLNFKKNQTGRPFSAPCGGPHRVLLPFLAEDLYLLYHATVHFGKRQRTRKLKTLKFRRLVQNNIGSLRMQGIFPLRVRNSRLFAHLADNWLGYNRLRR